MSCAVVVPTYRGARLIPARLEGILAQTRQPEQIIVIDDGSPTDMSDIVAPFADRVLYRRTENRGVQAARNLGVELATTTWIAFADDDDQWEPGHIEGLMNLAQAERDLTVLFSDFRILRDGTYVPTTKFEQAPPGWWDGVIQERLPAGWILGSDIAAATFQFHPIFPSALAVRRDFFYELGAFDVSRRGNRVEDGPFVTRALALGRTGAVPAPTATIIKHDDNMSSDVGLRDRMLNLLHEIDNLRYLRTTFPELAHLHPYIDREIATRSAMAAEAAFAAGDHARMREILRDVPPALLDGKLAMKAKVASMPDVIGKPLNHLLQAVVRLRG